MATTSAGASFVRDLRVALNSLYDPAVLRASPLIELFGLAAERNPISALRRTLLNGIESLRPNRDTPESARTWRVYQILRRRYTEQVTQREVAADLGLSIRQLQREERLAREVLADCLWNAHNLAAAPQGRPEVSIRDEGTERPVETQVPSRLEELESLKRVVHIEMVDVSRVVEQVLSTVEPLLGDSEISATFESRGEVAAVPSLEPILRQALLNVVSTAIHCVPAGHIRIQAARHAQQVSIEVLALARGTICPLSSQECVESLNMATQLIQLCGGAIETAARCAGQAITEPLETAAFTACVTLPMAAGASVLVIDDNADALRLFERYLSDTRYRFVGARSVSEGLALAQELLPQVVVLDVMMPERDGWAALGGLRENPQTSHIPVIVTTILPQKELAMALGAAEFVRKPVSRSELLSALDRQVDQPRTPPDRRT